MDFTTLSQSLQSAVDDVLKAKDKVSAADATLKAAEADYADKLAKAQTIHQEMQTILASVLPGAGRAPKHL